MRKLTSLVLSVSLAWLTLTGCAQFGPAAPAADDGSAIIASGSTAQLGAINAWRDDFRSMHPGARIVYRPNGSGAGLRDFFQGATDFAGSDYVMGAQEQALADGRCGDGAVHLPMVVGPIAVAYNLPSVPELRLSPATMAAVFGRTITTWDAPQIAADNPGAALPHQEIDVLHRSDASGTSHVFTSYLKAAGGWPYPPSTDWPGPGRGVEGSDGMAETIRDSEGSIGYADYVHTSQAGLRTTKVRDGAGEYVALSPESATKSLEDARISDSAAGVTLTPDYTTEQKGAYPLVLITYEIVCARGTSALTRGFLRYTASNAGQSYLSLLGYAPLPQDVVIRVRARLAAMT
ncbi:phosphate ABC transporter substrate-binding protein PstS [Nonomuraea roseoviolacea]|uniref:Phosphate-binding protein n=1 Tax=Nonomuraea roseoviolacea subsp. carminata TaxID=160689 RepID=A0ABT1KB39_9ACTN|nr:phosphate ABC transporter substrate-binding protein PstS [Nonomuraea roseoviolacea]MCP2351215.1 phosphate transport system substrate-binding protein [Nonomuraea roseoviolacea subsp. carminata]